MEGGLCLFKNYIKSFELKLPFLKLNAKEKEKNQPVKHARARTAKLKSTKPTRSTF